MSEKTEKTKVSAEDAQFFSINYKILQETVDKLRSSNIEDIDQLIELVEKANVAYKNCSTRIENIKAVVGKAST